MHQVSFRTMAFALLIFSWAVSSYAAESGAKLVDSSWVKAMKANDLDGVMKTYAGDAVAWLPGGPEARGEQAIRSAYQNLLSSNTVTEVMLSETGYKTMGKTSVGWGKFSLTLVPKAGGDPVVMKGRYTDIAERRGGRWVYIVDHASADPAGAEGAKK